MELTCGPAQENSLGSKSSQILWQEAVLEVFKVWEGTLRCQGHDRWAHLEVEPALSFGLNPHLFVVYLVAVKASKEDGSCKP